MDAGGKQIIETVLLDIALVAIPAACIIFAGKKLACTLGFVSAGLKKDAARALAVFAAIFSAAIAIEAAAAYLGINDLQVVSETIGLIAKSQPVLLVYLAVVRPFTEEVFFRGFLAPRAGIAVQAALFGVLHMAYGSVVEVLGAFALAAILGFSFMRFKSIIPNILAHWGYNLAAICAVVVQA